MPRCAVAALVAAVTGGIALYGAGWPVPAGASLGAPVAAAVCSPAKNSPVAIVYTFGKASPGNKKYHVHNGMYLGCVPNVAIKIAHVPKYPDQNPKRDNLTVCLPGITGKIAKDSKVTCHRSAPDPKKPTVKVQWQLQAVWPYQQSRPAIGIKAGSDWQNPHNGAFLCFIPAGKAGCDPVTSFPLNQKSGTLCYRHYANPKYKAEKLPDARLARNLTDFQLQVARDGPTVSAQKTANIPKATTPASSSSAGCP